MLRFAVPSIGTCSTKRVRRGKVSPGKMRNDVILVCNIYAITKSIVTFFKKQDTETRF